MAAPKVYIKEQDLSIRVPSFPGVYAGIAIEAPRGPTEPMLVTSEKQLLDLYTVNGRIPRGVDNTLLSAMTYLRYADKLWVVRAKSNDDRYAGLKYSLDQNGDPVVTPLSTGLSDPQEVGSPSGLSFTSSDRFVILAADPGSWANGGFVQLRFESIKRVANAPEVPDPWAAEAFVISVFVGGLPAERWVVSLNEAAVDGNGVSIFLETVLNRSAYIRGYANPGRADNNVGTLPAPGSGTAYPLAGGVTGTVTRGNMINAIKKLKEKDNYPLTLILDGGFADPAYAVELVNLAEQRQDAVAILSVPAERERSSNYLNAVVDYAVVPGTGVGGINSSYAALYSPHVLVYLADLDEYRYISPDGYAAGAISRTAANYEIWFPVGGWNRGRLNVIDILRHYSGGELDYLYLNNVNPIRYRRGKGIAIWGQKTLWRIPSALDRLNVRLLLIVIENAIAEALENFLFELNDEFTRRLVRAMIESYMEDIKSRRGVYDYLVVCDESNNSPVDIDNYRLNVDLYVKPTKAIEYIHFRTVITPTGVDFSMVRGG